MLSKKADGRFADTSERKVRGDRGHVFAARIPRLCTDAVPLLPNLTTGDCRSWPRLLVPTLGAKRGSVCSWRLNTIDLMTTHQLTLKGKSKQICAGTPSFVSGVLHTRKCEITANL